MIGRLRLLCPDCGCAECQQQRDDHGQNIFQGTVGHAIPPPACAGPICQTKLQGGRAAGRWMCAVGRGVLSFEWPNDVEEAGRSQEKGKLQTVDSTAEQKTRRESSEAVALCPNVMRHAVAEQEPSARILRRQFRKALTGGRKIAQAFQAKIAAVGVFNHDVIAKLERRRNGRTHDSHPFAGVVMPKWKPFHHDLPLWNGPTLPERGAATMVPMKAFLILCCIVGTLVPWWFALPFFLIHGPNFGLFLEEMFATRISSFFAADLLVASVIFLAWSWQDARKRHVSGWWIVLLSNLVVGLSLALPLYLLKRHEAKTKQASA